MKKVLLTMLVLYSAAIGAQENQRTRFSVDEAIAYALNFNRNLKNASRDLKDAEAQKWITIASGLPQIAGSVQYQNQLKQPVAQIPAEFFGGAPGTYTTVVFGQPQSMNASVQWNQLLFDGSYIVGVQATKTFLDYSKNLFEKTLMQVRTQTVKSYTNVLIAEAGTALLLKNKASLDQSIVEVTALMENGLIEEEALEQLKITSFNIESQLKNSKRLVEISHQMLNLVMGRPISAELQLSESIDDMIAKDAIGALLERSFELDQNVDFKMVSNLNSQRSLELKLAKSKALPTLSAFWSYGQNSFSDSFNFLGEDNQWFQSSIVGVNLEIPIFSSLLRTAQTQRAKIAYEQAKTQKEETISLLELDYANKSSAYELAIDLYNNSRQNLELAERIAHKNEIKFKEGISSSFDLRQAQLQLYESQQEYLLAMQNLITSRVELENLMNTSL